MKTKSDNKLKIWEISLLIALCLSLCAGIKAHADQQELASQIVRLHVIAESDSDEDQAVKLKVRDKVLEVLTPALADAKSIDEAKSIIADNLPALETAAEEELRDDGHDVGAKATLSVENYPLRVYNGFSLPAGDYVSLRVILGEGKGHNWWCVVFPPLCMTAVEDRDAFASLSEDSRELIVSEDGGYKLKFRIIEWFEYLRAVIK